MRHPLVLLALAATLATAVPAAAQERTDWSVLTSFRATGKACQLRFAVPRGSPSVTLEHRPATASRGALAALIFGGLPRHLSDEKASLRDIRASFDNQPIEGLKGDWRGGTDDASSRVIVLMPYDGLVAALARSFTLKVDVPLPGDPQAFSVDLRGSAAPVASYAACIATP
jgi:hypothetical protein